MSLTGVLGSTLGSLASNLLGSGNPTGAGASSFINPEPVVAFNPVNVSRDTGLIQNAATQAGTQAATDVQNRYATLGLGNSTMSSLDASQAKSFPMINAANQIANLDFAGQKFNSQGYLNAAEFNVNTDLNAQEFNAKAAQQYQAQAQAQNLKIQELLGSLAGKQAGTGNNTGTIGGNTGIFTTGGQNPSGNTNALTMNSPGSSGIYGIFTNSGKIIGL